MLTVKDKYLYSKGRRIFYLADTNWGAFSSINMNDWKYYLHTRKEQGFNAIQINLLRQWDNGEPLKGRNPFPISKEIDGKYKYDYTKINESYFDNAEKMLDEMMKINMIPSLVLLWGNYVPGTWMRGISPNNIMPFEDIKPYIEYVVERFKKYHPLWIVSGDVGFGKAEGPDPEKTKKYYQEVLNVAKTVDTKGIFSFHINGGSSYLPQEFLKEVNVFLYQSGHDISTQSSAYSIPRQLRKRGFKGPIIDSELCYEGLIEISKDNLERYHDYDVRKAAWEAVLSGADAGLGYGTFGIWPWTDSTRPETLARNIFTRDLKPFDWRVCLNLKGARDLGFLKQLMLNLSKDELMPINNKSKDFFAAESRNHILIYLPTNNTFNFDDLGLTVDCCQVVELDSNDIKEGTIINNTLQLGTSLEDKLIVIDKK
ncbi:apiosidase-like domain-containing protein [Companilactobacillus sp. HBUAS56275]|uniref:DUF4038 domain-containing protein n=1 Tax=Candidatus Companilactobacillus pullicola TaxID=2838523 RepID=A0A9D1ZMP3_9LACO|nr:DUF4038 domain-containing protein [Candidatus Companilactobacillus pullicola]